MPSLVQSNIWFYSIMCWRLGSFSILDLPQISIKSRLILLQEGQMWRMWHYCLVIGGVQALSMQKSGYLMAKICILVRLTMTGNLSPRYLDTVKDMEYAFWMTHSLYDVLLFFFDFETCFSSYSTIVVNDLSLKIVIWLLQFKQMLG